MTSTPTPPRRNFEDIYDDPDLDPYPEFTEEVFQDYLESGLKPENLTEPDASEYARWLKRRGASSS